MIRSQALRINASKVYICLNNVEERCFYKGLSYNIWERVFRAFRYGVATMTSTWDKSRNFKVPYSIPNYFISLRHIWLKIKITNNYRILSKLENQTIFHNRKKYITERVTLESSGKDLRYNQTLKVWKTCSKTNYLSKECWLILYNKFSLQKWILQLCRRSLN